MPWILSGRDQSVLHPVICSLCRFGGRQLSGNKSSFGLLALSSISGDVHRNILSGSNLRLSQLHHVVFADEKEGHSLEMTLAAHSHQLTETKEMEKRQAVCHNVTYDCCNDGWTRL